MTTTGLSSGPTTLGTASPVLAFFGVGAIFFFFGAVFFFGFVVLTFGALTTTISRPFLPFFLTTPRPGTFVVLFAFFFAAIVYLNAGGWSPWSKVT